MADMQLAAITVDCADPGALAAFYCAAAGAELTHEDEDSAWVVMAGVTWIYRMVDDYRAPTWPSSEVPLQVHLEFYVDDLVQAEKVLHGYGATSVSPQPNPGRGLIVMLDPAGRPFCIATR
jgi:hypothetical protein